MSRFSDRFGDLVGESWDFLSGFEREPDAPLNMMDLVLGRGSITSMFFGRHVEMPNWDGPVPSLPAPPAEPVQTGPASSSARTVGSPKLQRTSSRVHPTEEDALKRTAALRTWASIVETFKGATSAFVELRGSVTPESMEP